MIKLAIYIILTLLVVLTGYRLIRLKVSVTTYRLYWAKLAFEKPTPDDFIYVALGDSTAQAIGASKPSNGYVALVGKHIEQKTGKKVHIINLSVSGAKIQDVINDQLPKLSKIPKVDMVTIEIGANNVATYDEAEFTAEFSGLLDKLPVGTYVADVPSFAGGRKRGLSKTSEQAAAVADQLIVQRPQLNVVKLYDKTKGQGLNDFAADYFHPNNSGYKNWAAAFIEAIEK